MTRKQNSIVLRNEPPTPAGLDYEADASKLLSHAMRWPARIGLAVIVIFIFGLGGWAAFVPLAGGALAPGVLSPDGSKRTVQHLEGGIIRRLHVRDGDVVEKGQPLLVLESIQPKAKYDVLRKRKDHLLITQARLLAESEQKAAIDFPQAVLASRDAQTRKLIEGQKRLFMAKREAHFSRQNILRQRVRQLEEQIRGFQLQKKSVETQIAIVREEIRGKSILRKKGLLAKPVLLRLQRAEAELDGQLGRQTSVIAETEQKIGETRLQLIANDAEWRNEVVAKADEIASELNTIDEQILASQDVLERTVVRAPVDGKIINLQFKTESGVVQPGSPILDIVPADEKLLIDARISPMDIDVVRAGLGAEIQLSAFSSRSTPRLSGYVRDVSADRIEVEGQNEPYYLARVEVDRAGLDQLRSDGVQIELLPGMPADVLIVTGKRTLADYLLEPFMDAVWKTFREV